jgi:nicotinamidase-related amidase
VEARRVDGVESYGAEMTTLTDRPNAALVVIDVQVGVVEHAYDRDVVVARIASLVERARTAAGPVIWVQHSSDELVVGSPAWEVVPELVRASDEPVVAKTYGDAFEATDLEQVLRERGVGQLLVTGAQTDACVRSTLHGALARGYDTVLVSDAHTTEDLSAYGAPTPDLVVAHTNLYWSFQRAPGRTAGTVVAADVDFTRP